MLTSARTAITSRGYILYYTYKVTSNARYCNNAESTHTCVVGNAKPTRTSEVPSPRGLPVFGTLLSLIRAGGAAKLHEYIDGRHRSLGPVFKEKLGNVEAVFVSDPEYMRSVFAQEGSHPAHVIPEAWLLYNRLYGCSRGLLFMEGEEWLYYRRIMNNLLLKGDITYIENCCDLVARNTLPAFSDKRTNLEQIMYRWSLETLVCILLGKDVYNNNKNQFADNLKVLSETVHLVFETSAKLQLVPATLAAKWNLRVWIDFVKSVNNALSNSNDLVVKLIQLHPNSDGLLGAMLRQNMHKTDTIKIISDLVLAAGDTTAYTMQWILYLLATNPDMQENLNKELNQHSLKNFIKETLRLYPVAPFITRFMPNNCAIGPYSISKDTLVILSLFTSGRDSNVYSKPDSFDPDRWLNKTIGMSRASLPFAMGSRSCVGKKIADSQLESMLKHVITNFKVEMVRKEKIDIVLKLVAVPSKPLNLKFITRT